LPILTTSTGARQTKTEHRCGAPVGLDGWMIMDGWMDDGWVDGYRGYVRIQRVISVTSCGTFRSEDRRRKCTKQQKCWHRTLRICLVIKAPRFCGRKAICLLTLLTYRSELNYALSAKVYLFGLCMCENQPDCRGQNSESKWQ